MPLIRLSLQRLSMTLCVVGIAAAVAPVLAQSRAEKATAKIAKGENARGSQSAASENAAQGRDAKQGVRGNRAGGGRKQAEARDAQSAAKPEAAKPGTKADNAKPDVKPDTAPVGPDKSKAAPEPAKVEPAGPPPPPDEWLDTEIDAALAVCSKVIDAAINAAPVPPIRSGVCGTPAPVALKGLNSMPKFEVRPAATMTCPLAAAIRRWMELVVQPAAKKYLDANVLRIDNASAYVCRTRYNDPMQQMSQHAFGNALDIGAFITAKGEKISVLDHWYAGDERAAFLQDVHKGACGIFGTVLGPEANAAHKNHFHLDMTPRKRSSYCQ